MKAEEILELSRIIAKYDGGVYEHQVKTAFDKTFEFDVWKFSDEKGFDEYREHDLKYHYSWDWFIPVFAKYREAHKDGISEVINYVAIIGAIGENDCLKAFKNLAEIISNNNLKP